MQIVFLHNYCAFNVDSLRLLIDIIIFIHQSLQQFKMFELFAISFELKLNFFSTRRVLLVLCFISVTNFDFNEFLIILQSNGD